MSVMTEAYQVHLNDKSQDHNSPTLFSNLVLVQVSKPTPGPGQVLVRIRAAALNFRDLLVLSSSPIYPVPTGPGITPGADGAGEIELVGAGSKWIGCEGQGVILVTNNRWIEGDDPSQYDVAGTLGAGNVNGTLRQYAVVKDELLIRKPANLGFEEAAAIVAVGGTAMHTLGVVDIGKGTTVLTQGTGGVSCLTIMLAAALGAHVIATSSSDEKLEIARGLGATELINYKSIPDWATEVLRLTDGKGVDLVSDVGGAGTVQQSLLAVKEGGTVAMVGFLSASSSPDIIPTLIFGGKTLKGIRGNSKAMLERATKIIENHNLHPPIGKPYEWNDAKAAFEALRNQDFVGKVVVKV